MTKHDSPVVLLPGAAPTGPTHATPKSYVDTRSAPAGGTLGQALTKNSSTDYDYSWVAIGGGSPSGAAGGSLAGTYPNPTILAGAIGSAEIAAAIKDAAAATASLRTLGTGAAQAAAGNDGRLSDARTPVAHASSHASGGSDAITPAAIGAAQRLTVTAVKTADYTAVAGDYVLMDASGAARTVTLPAAVVGATIAVKKTDTSANTVSIAPNGTDTFQGGATTNPVLQLQDTSRILVGVSGGWVAISNLLTVASLDTRYTPQTRQVLAGTGLTGGGDLTADRTLTVAYGTTSTTAAAGNDARLSDARTPLAHASSHAVGGGDVLTPAAIGAFPKLTATANKTSAYTAVDGDLVMCDDTGGSFTVTLPAATVGRVVGVKKLASSSFLVTISRAGTDTIGAAAATTVDIRLTDQMTVLQCTAAGVWTPIWNWVSVPGMDARYGRLGTASTYTAKQTFSTVTVNTPVVLTDAATVAVDASLGNFFRLTTTSGVGATRAMGVPSGTPSDGTKILFEIIQDAAGSRLVTWPATTGGYAFGADVTSPTLSTGVNKVDYVGFIYNATANIWRCLAVAKGY